MIIIPGKPIAKNRPRFSKHGAYSDQKPLENSYKNELLVKRTRIYNGPVFVGLHFYFKRPKSHYRSGKYKHILKDSAPFFHESKPDIDNLIKWTCDCANGILFPDDMRITGIYATKQYSENGNERTEIEIREESLPDEPPF